ncbi:MAG: hypothetical protein IJZ76_10670 [Lachnospiraceae bacterium]|nr:hypothetical protein [Lachnospiraceae bacterium]
MMDYLSYEEVLKKYNDSKVTKRINDFHSKFIKTTTRKPLSKLNKMFGLPYDSFSFSELSDYIQASYLVSMLQSLSDVPVKGHYIVADTHLFPFQISSVAYCDECEHCHYGYDCIFVNEEGCGIEQFCLDNAICLNEDNLTFRDVYRFLCDNTGINKIPTLV